MAAVHSTFQLQNRVTSLSRELEAAKIQLAAVLRNYTTVSKLLHERLQLLEDTSQQLVAEKTEAEQLKGQLEVTINRAEQAEQQLKHGTHLNQEYSKLQQETSELRASRQEDYQQRVALQEQLNRIKQDLYAAANSRQQLQDQLQEQCDLTRSANSTITKLRQQLDDEQTEGRSVASQLQALKEALAHSTAEQQELQKQLSALKVHNKAVEDALAAEQAKFKQLQQDLHNAKGGQANNALKLLDVTTSQQLLSEKHTRTLEDLAQERAARAAAEKQVVDLQSQVDAAQQRIEALEAHGLAAAVALTLAQQQATDALTAQYAAEEARKTADAATKLITQRLAEVQHQAAEDKGVAEAANHELQERLTNKELELQQQRQQEQSWRFRQLESITRAVSTLDQLQSRVTTLDAASHSCAEAVEQQHQQQQDHFQQQISQIESWVQHVEGLAETGSRINTALVHVAQQWVAKQQMIRSNDKGLQVLQKQVEQLEQQLSVATAMQLKSRQELAGIQDARQHDQAEAKHELEQAAAAVAVAEAAAAAAQSAHKQAEATLAQLETKLASAETDLVALRFQIAAKDSEVSLLSTNVKAATTKLQKLAVAASDMAGMLERVGALQSQDIAAVLAELGVIKVRPCTAPSTSRPSTPAAVITAAAGAVAGSSEPGSTAAAVAQDAAGSRQLLDGLGCLHQQMQVLVTSAQQLAVQYPKLLSSWQDNEREVAGVASKLMHVEESLASNYTCLVCMKVFDHPVSVVPCGHNYCRACFTGTMNSRCRECGDSAQTASCIPAPALEQLCAKYEYRLVTLKGLQSLLAQRQVHSVNSSSAEHRPQVHDRHNV